MDCAAEPSHLVHHLTIVPRGLIIVVLLTRIDVSLALCVGMGEAARLCSQDMDYDAQWISFLSNKLLRLVHSRINSCSSPFQLFTFSAYREVMSRIPMVVLNGDPVARYVGNVNLSFAHVEGESLLMVREVDSFRFVS